jgi:hypothetical protein
MSLENNEEKKEENNEKKEEKKDVSLNSNKYESNLQQILIKKPTIDQITLNTINIELKIAEETRSDLRKIEEFNEFIEEYNECLFNFDDQIKVIKKDKIESINELNFSKKIQRFGLG